MTFTCPFCGAVSHNPHDVEQRFCGRCHVFVDDEIERRGGVMDFFKSCRHCHGRRFVPGPRGAGSQNVTCMACGAKFNLILATQLSPTVPPILIDEIAGPSEPIDITPAYHWLIEILDD